MKAKSPLRWIWVLIAVFAIVPLLIGLGIDVFGSDDGGGSPAGEPSATASQEDEGDDAEPWQVAMVVGFIALCFAGSWFLARGVLRRVSRSHVIEQGVPATAVIASMAETGTTINEQPMVEFELRVRREGAEPYDVAIQQVLPRLLLGRVQPGMTVGVKVMPDDANEVAIDWQSISGVGPDGIEPRVMDKGLFAGTPVGETVDTDAFLLKAIPARAEIDEMSETGMTVKQPRSDDELEVFAFKLTVHRDDGTTYEAKLLQGVPHEHRGRFGPGATLPIGINPDDPFDVAINWREHERAERRRDLSGS